MTRRVGLPVVTLHDLATGQARPCTRDVTLGLGDLLPWRRLTTFTAQASSRPGNPPAAYTSGAEHAGTLRCTRTRIMIIWCRFLRLHAWTRSRRHAIQATHRPTDQGWTNALTGSEHVRYWSMCIGGMSSQTSACVPDFEAKLDAEGYVTLVISDGAGRRARHATGIEPPVLGQPRDPGPDLPESCQPSAPVPNPFQGSARVLRLSRRRIPWSSSPKRFIGPYAPVGVQCTSRHFLRIIAVLA